MGGLFKTATPLEQRANLGEQIYLARRYGNAASVGKRASGKARRRCPPPTWKASLRTSTGWPGFSNNSPRSLRRPSSHPRGTSRGERSNSCWRVTRPGTPTSLHGWRWRSSLPGPRTTRARASGMPPTTSSTASRARPLGSRSPPTPTRRGTPAVQAMVATRPATRARRDEPPSPRQSLLFSFSFF
uniref:Uncharacterized protein n=1 Tax=Oryza sativa subsp. japonica TaxID=39947 RepID=Q5QMK6_ORYSJ|nr:hypothetical protein [Oryza sativa Japonica Group]BAD82296.1 hypothetical protein [Oryza sativa Japonica Group]